VNVKKLGKSFLQASESNTVIFSVVEPCPIRATQTEVNPNPPNPPVDVRIVEKTKRSMTVGWRDNSDDETGFHLERRKRGEDWKTVLVIVRARPAGSSADPGATVGQQFSRTDVGLVPNGEYCFRIKVVGQRAESFSTEVCDKTLPLEPPQAPSDLQVVAIGDKTVSLAWTDNSTNEAYFRIEMRTPPDQTWFSPGPLDSSANSQSRNIDGLKPATEYCFRVRAINDDGSSPASNEACATTSGTIEHEVSTTIYLVPQPIVEGVVPFTARFPLLGNSDDLLSKVTLPEQYLGDLIVSFVKPGHTTAQCNDPGSVAMLREGQSLSGDGMRALFGSTMPPLPVQFLACVAKVPSGAISPVALNITYVER
jgi:Fibronectin type III domain